MKRNKNILQFEVLGVQYGQRFDFYKTISPETGDYKEKIVIFDSEAACFSMDGINWRIYECGIFNGVDKLEINPEWEYGRITQ